MRWLLWSRKDSVILIAYSTFKKAFFVNASHQAEPRKKSKTVAVTDSYVIYSLIFIGKKPGIG